MAVFISAVAGLRSRLRDRVRRVRNVPARKEVDTWTVGLLREQNNNICFLVLFGGLPACMDHIQGFLVGALKGGVDDAGYLRYTSILSSNRVIIRLCYLGDMPET